MQKVKSKTVYRNDCDGSHVVNYRVGCSTEQCAGEYKGQIMEF